MRLDVVVPTYGRPRDLQVLLGLLAAQSRPADRILVVDDSPGEEVAAVARASRVPGVEYHRNPGPRSAAGARNHGMDVSTGDLVVFLDNDVRPKGGYLEAMERAFRLRPQAVGAMGHVANLPGVSLPKRWVAKAFALNHTTPASCRMYANLNTTYPRRLAGTIEVDWLWACNMALTREAVDRVRFETQFIRYSLHEDVELSLRLRKEFPGRPLLMVHDAVLEDQRSEEGRIPDLDAVRMHIINRAFILHRYGQYPWWRDAHLAWTDLGSQVVNTWKKPRQAVARAKATLSGWRLVRRHRDELRRGDLSRLNQTYSFHKGP